KAATTFNRSRSFRLIRSSILVLLPATRPERGQFYFAETGHYHFAATRNPPFLDFVACGR
ncbi:MAG TPA: hypothetical protein VMY35_05650, partial [Phycisphaerae bacterium]|nr:hypothetical protein [Phycisphaerae bacterium]